MYLTSADSEIGPTMNAHEFINHDLEFALSNLYIPIEEKIICMLDEMGDGIDNEPIEEVDSVQIGGEVVDKVGFKDIEIALVALKQFLGQNPIDAT
jgi:hypothetical protein